jgi:hypothetical protein
MILFEGANGMGKSTLLSAVMRMMHSQVSRPLSLSRWGRYSSRYST